MFNQFLKMPCKNLITFKHPNIYPPKVKLTDTLGLKLHEQEKRAQVKSEEYEKKYKYGAKECE